ncbi:MAG: tail protein X [Firmicutes bacterium]|nr:tail protein X [Bacillota bacterium]MDY5855597.1 tail protein X [Anaerovoracaceae bacterium]
MTYTTKDGDMWDMIAKKVYGNELLADRLLQANRGLAGVFKFDAGEVIIVPEIEDGEAAGLPPWRD